MKIALATLVTAVAATLYLGLDRGADVVGCEPITWPAEAAAPAAAAVDVAPQRLAPVASTPQPTALAAIDTLAEEERAIVVQVADILERDPVELAEWAAPRDSVRDFRDIYAMLDDEGGRPHMRDAFEQYMALRDQLPADAALR